MSDPLVAFPCPVIHLAHGPWRAAVADPRDPQAAVALGARYVHGGYVAAWWRGERLLTGAPHPEWDPYNGQGLPEVFEYPLGRSAAGEGQPFLRIGVGHLLREGPEWPQARGPLVRPTPWELVEQSASHVTLRGRDELAIAGKAYGYELVREVRLHDDGLTSRSMLTLACPWSHPVFWFAHPFFAHADGPGTGFVLPSGATPTAGKMQVAPDGAWRFVASNRFAVATGVWGRPEPVRVLLDPRCGGGRVDLELDRPLDKLVLYASEQVGSVEPYWSRAWSAGETASWSLTYRWMA